MTTNQIAKAVWDKALSSAKEITKHTQTAEDAASHTLEMIMTRLDEWDGRPIENWAGIIARNKAIALKKRDGRYTDFDVHEYRLSSEEEPAVADYISLHKAINTLKPREIEVIIQHYFEGKEFQVIAEQTGEPLSTIKVRCMRARNKLKNLL